MKEPIEELFKKSLENHEMPFNAAAWSALSSKLDATAPSPSPSTSKGKYYAAAAAVCVLSVASYFFFTQDDSAQVKQETIAKTTKTNELAEPSTVIKPITAQQVETSTVAEERPIIESENTISTQVPVIAIQPSVEMPSSQEDKGGNNEVNQATTDNGSSTTQANEVETTNETPIYAKKFTAPSIPSMCTHEDVAIENKNDEALCIVAPNGEMTTIAAGKSLNYTPELAGTYQVGYMNRYVFVSEGTFVAKAGPEADIIVDTEFKFENGLPTTEVSTSAYSEEYSWTTENGRTTGKNATFHFYKAGPQTIQLEISNGQCSTTISRTVDIEEYNLMAVTGFNPNDSDPRKRTFMPYALTERSTNFRLVIIDSRDGGVVYETNDVNQPWDGTDRRTGEINSSTTYIWKVVLENPEPNEPAEYMGTITKL